MPQNQAFSAPTGPSGYTFAASVADALLYQFKEYARFAVDNGDFVVDASYEKVLQGLQVAAPQVGTAVLDTLLKWRSDTLREVGNSRSSDTAAVLRRRLVVEALFLEAALRLVGGDPLAIPLPTARELENLSFDWILNSERYVTIRTPDLTRLRDRVVLGASQLLGKLSAVSLDSIVDRFLTELALRIKAEANSPQRQELYTLCHGLRFLRLHGDTPAQLRSATNFLENVFPLKHVAPDKKSRLQQAIADMLTSALTPLTDQGDPGSFGVACDPGLRKQWFATVSLLRTELLRWTTKQAKQLAAGLPAVTVLTCLQEESALIASIDSLVELLHKQLKDKKNASMALLCLVRCVACFLNRLRDRSDTDRLTKWVARSVSPAVQAVAKGQLIAPEQLELMRQLCTVVVAALPEFGIRGMVLELLATDGSQPWESSMAGLMALMSILLEAPARVAGKELPLVDLPATTSALESAAAAASPTGGWGNAAMLWTPSNESCEQLLEYVKSGHHPLEAHGVQHLIAPVSAAVARLLAQCHQLHGYTRLTNSSARPSVDLGPRDRLSALPVFVSVLQITPFVVPDTWATGGMADDLPSYTIHVEPSVRSASIASIHRCMIALPGMRDALVGGMATFIVRLQEEFTDVIKESLLLLLEMMRNWDRLAAVDTAMSLAAGEPAPQATALGVFNNISRVEGAMLGLLCSPDIEVRQMAVDLLRGSRALHKSLALKTGGGGSGGGETVQTFGLASGTTSTSSGGGAFGAPSSTRSSSSHHHQGSLSVDPPPILSLPQHVRRSTTSSTGNVGSSDRISSAHPHSAVHHSRRSTLGSVSAFTPAASGASFSQPWGSNGHGGIDSPAAGAPLHSATGSANGALPGSIPTTPAGDSIGTSADDLHYVADIIERLGDVLVRKLYWDYGQYSDMWREWRPVPPEASFADCLARTRNSDESQGLRWARILYEITREAWKCCERSAWWTHVEVASKLQSLMVVEPTGRPLLPQEGLRGELARSFTMIAAAAPLLDASHLGDRGLITREFVRLLVSSARSGVDYVILALGCMDSSCHTLVATEAAVLVEDYSPSGGAGSGGSGGGSQGGFQSGATSGARALGGRSVSRGRREDTSRLVHAHVLRVLCSNLPAGSLTRNVALRDQIVAFVRETQRQIAHTVDVSPETQQLRYCLCIVAREAASQLAEAMPQVFPPMFRRTLFDQFTLYSEDAQTPGLFRSELRRHIAVAKAQMKGRDGDQLRNLEGEMVDAAEMVEHAANTAMATMLGGPIFDADAGKREGRVIAWLDRMLAPSRDTPAGLPGINQNPLSSSAAGETTWGPPKEHTARVALRNLLRSSVDLASVFVDRSYSPLPRVATAYFLVLAEVYANTDLPIEPYVIVALVLHKVVDIVPAVRDAARGMLGTLSRRNWNQTASGLSRRTTVGTTAGVELAEETVDGAVVIGSLAESHRAYQQHLSTSLARDHAELAHGIVIEILNRHLSSGAGAAAAGGEVLLCLPPWLEYANFGRGQWEGQWGVTVLRLLCAVTVQVQQGIRRAYPVQKLWATVASNRRNILPALDFLISQGMAESAALTTQPSGSAAAAATSAALPPSICSVGKQAALYLSRVAPRQTIDHLSAEAAQKMVEQDEGGDGDGLLSAGSAAASRRGSNASVALGGMSLTPATSRAPSGVLTPPRNVEWVRIKEFHNKASSAPVQQRLPQQQPLAVHAAAAVAAATASSSKPLTPSSIAMAIKRSTLDLIVKTGAAVVDTVAVAGAAAVGMTASGLTTPGNMPRGSRASIEDVNTSYGPMGSYSQSFGAAAGGSSFGPAAAGGSSFTSQYGSASAAAGGATANVPTPSSAVAATPIDQQAPPPVRTALTRPEVALCLLSEVACERDEELRAHLPALLHLAVLHADSTNEFVRQESCQLLQYLLYSLACKPLEGQGHGAGGQGLGAGLGIRGLGGASGGGGGSGAPSADYARVAGVIGYLQSLGGEPLWAWELPTLAQPWVASAGYVAAFVQLVADSFLFDRSLRERWSAEALKWACCAASRHAASRSHQVFCALSPALTSAACTALLAALQKCLQSASAQGLDTAVEILCTLRVLLANTPPQKLVLYPHLLAACIALLCSSVVRVGELAAALLVQLLDAIDVSSPVVQTALTAVLPLDTPVFTLGSKFGAAAQLNQDPQQQQQQQGVVMWPLGEGLLAGAPDVENDEAAGGPWLALPQLLVKGLFQVETEALAFEGMAAIARQIAGAGARGRLSRPSSAMRDATNLLVLSSGERMSGVEMVFGRAEVALAISIGATMPWLCVHVGAGELADTAASFLNDISAACGAVGWEQLSAVLAVLAAGPPPAPPGAGAAAWLPDFAEAVTSALFPAYSRIVVQRLMETVQRGEERYQSAALSSLKALFSVPGLHLGSAAWFAHGSHLVQLLSSEVGGPLGPKVLDVLQALAAFRDDSRDTGPTLEWRQCMDDLGESNKVCAEALRRVVEACPGSAELKRATSASKLAVEGGESAGIASGVSGGGLGGVGAGVGGGGGEGLLPFLPSKGAAVAAWG